MRFQKQLFAVAVVLLGAALVGASACNYIVNKSGSDSGASVVGPTPASPTPDPLCTARSIDLGAKDDAKTIPQGGAVDLVLSVFGSQKELQGDCLANVHPTYTVSAPCVLEGGGFNAAVRAPASAPIGATCTAVARAAGFEDEHKFTVVSP